ncbi:osteopetrosis-associated transmembrane protein 1 [Spea bombifrons]|uniref:osteopetrosis-associated transmembrane protein 1 n=1 Tax=Spea bombifrons TaxID=233779 RepID=UPI00234BBDBD|nr:osteopetrosis-associated transmembrane protein 1 [Spea bombifrons]
MPPCAVHPVHSLLFCYLLSCACLATSWYTHNVDGAASSDLLSQSLWAEELSLSLLPSYYSARSFSDGPEVCSHLLIEFANSSAALSECLVKNARPVRLCQKCRHEYVQLRAVMDNITQKQNNTDICAQLLLQSDRVHVLVILNEFFQNTWEDSKCDDCLENNSTQIKNSTTEFMQLYDKLNNCFNNSMKKPEFQKLEGNYSRVCQNCNVSYRSLNALYSKLELSKALCIDLEDAMNSTRTLWSRVFNCTVPCTDTVPVIAVSVFIFFLPVVFYLSSYLHSEQKKLKLVLPKRLLPNANIANIQDHSN